MILVSFVPFVNQVKAAAHDEDHDRSLCDPASSHADQLVTQLDHAIESRSEFLSGPHESHDGQPVIPAVPNDRCSGVART